MQTYSQKNKYKSTKRKLLLPILSIVLIGGGLIAAVLIAGGNFDFRRQAYDDNASIKDKFGIGSGCNIAADLGIPWVYMWGHGGNYPNGAETGCNKSKGISFFFTIGKLDNAEKYPKIDEWESKYILPEELADYEEYKNVIARATKPEFYPNAIASYILIPMYVNELGYKGAYYAVANEPDFLPFVGPAVYAKQYKLIHDRIKKYDPTAKVSVGGLLEVVPEACRPWMAQAGLDCSNRFTWLDTLRQSYRETYGSPIPVDFWNIHPYVYAHNHSSAEALDRVDQFKAYLDRTGEGNKPVWITEFGSLAKEGELVGKPCTGNSKDASGKTIYCLSLEDRKIEHQMMADLVQEVVIGYAQRPYIERWFYFYGGETWPWEPKLTNFVGDIYKYAGESDYHAVGQKYRQLMNLTYGGLMELARQSQSAPTVAPEPEPAAQPITVVEPVRVVEPVPVVPPSAPVAEPQPVAPATSNYNPTGYHDFASCGRAQGWACDQDNLELPLAIHVYKNVGKPDQAFLGATTANAACGSGQDCINLIGACGNSNGGNRRFYFEIKPEMNVKPGDTVDAFAINIDSQGNNSGSNGWLTNQSQTYHMNGCN